MRPHFKFWPRRLPHSITLPTTSLWDNLAINARRYPDKAAVVFFGRALSYRALAEGAERLAATILTEYAAAARKIKDTKNAPEATADAQQQLQRLVPKNFIAAAPWAQLAHYARYLKAITLRLDKYRADPARDATKLAELRPQEQRYWRLVAERKGAVDARMQELRWLLEELRVSFFAQELRTPQPVSVKRLDKLWAQIQS